MSERFRIRGRLEEEETGRPLGDLVVRAFDRDWLFDDKLGFATSDADGRFEIVFDSDRFSELFETRPDLYLRIFDALGTREIHRTLDAVRWNASPDEVFRVRIPARALAESQ